MGLTSWAAFQPVGTQTIVMGDMVLLEDQVNPVLSVALMNGLEVTALHNHFFWESPKVMFMHIGGMGNTEALAGAVGKVFATIKETSGGKGSVPHADLDPAKTSLDPKPIEDTLGVKGQMANGVYKVTIGRTTNMHGHEVGNTMGVNTWAAFMGSDDTAVVEVILRCSIGTAAGAESAAWRGHQYRSHSSAPTLETPGDVFAPMTRALATGLKCAGHQSK
jgi:hypothetical protein